MSDISMADLRLLAVFAHRDDESYRAGGTLAQLARKGVQVWVLCATQGEGGGFLACPSSKRARFARPSCSVPAAP